MTNYTNEENVTEKTPIDEYIKKIEETQKEQSSFIKILAVMTIIFLGIIFAIFIFADNKEFLEDEFGTDSPITRIFIKLTQSNTNKEKAEFSLPFGLRKQNILLLGVDSNGEGSDLWKGTRTDTIVLINIDPKSKSLNAISIPRDSKVYLPKNNGVQKINAAHAIGGINMAIRTIEDTLGIKVDKYIMVHDEAVRKIVEALGGVDIYVEKNMHYNDYSGNLHINLTKGHHHLNSEEVIGYLRFRHDAMGDIGRTQRQQWFLRGLLQELQKPQTIAKIPDILSVAKKYVKTDMSLYEMSQYAALAKHFDINNIEIATLPGAPNKKGYTSYWILDPEKTQEVVDRLIYREKNKNNKTEFKANIMYSDENAEKANQLVTELETNNIKIKCTGSTNATHAQFIAHTKEVTPEFYNWLRKKVPELNSKQFVYDPVNYYCSDTDFTIIMAGQ